MNTEKEPKEPRNIPRGKMETIPKEGETVTAIVNSNGGLGKCQLLFTNGRFVSPDKKTDWTKQVETWSYPPSSPDAGEKQRQEHSDTWDAAVRWREWISPYSIEKGPVPNKHAYLNNKFPSGVKE